MVFRSIGRSRSWHRLLVELMRSIHVSPPLRIVHPILLSPFWFPLTWNIFLVAMPLAFGRSRQRHCLPPCRYSQAVLALLSCSVGGASGKATRLLLPDCRPRYDKRWRG